LTKPAASCRNTVSTSRSAAAPSFKLLLNLRRRPTLAGDASRRCADQIFIDIPGCALKVEPARCVPSAGTIDSAGTLPISVGASDHRCVEVSELGHVWVASGMEVLGGAGNLSSSHAEVEGMIRGLHTGAYRAPRRLLMTTSRVLCHVSDFKYRSSRALRPVDQSTHSLPSAPQNSPCALHQASRRATAPAPSPIRRREQHSRCLSTYVNGAAG
jgi:hypothetical protein